MRGLCVYLRPLLTFRINLEVRGNIQACQHPLNRRWNRWKVKVNICQLYQLEPMAVSPSCGLLRHFPVG